jgi:hypothetical protein
VGVRGIRQGKKPKSPEDYQRLSSRLCRGKYLRLYKEFLQKRKQEGSTIDDDDYQKVKAQACSEEWATLKSIILAGGPLAGWLRNSIGDE